VLIDVTDLFAIGIGCDIAGAYLLARGLLVSPRALWVRFTFAGLMTRFVDEARDRVMAVVGLLALVTGFLIQALGYALTLAIGSSSDKSFTRALVALALSAATVALVVGVEAATRRRRLRSLLLAIARADTVGEGPAGAPTLRVLIHGAPAIGVERKKEESDADYARRAFGVRELRIEPSQ
jgi:hypothetical protein